MRFSEVATNTNGFIIVDLYYNYGYEIFLIAMVKKLKKFVMLELFDFQERAALKIVEKYENYLRQPINQLLLKKEKKKLQFLLFKSLMP